MKTTSEDTRELETLLADLEPAVIRSQFKRLVERLEETLEKRLEDEGAAAGRGLLENMALIAGDRRMKSVSIVDDRRRS